MYSAFVRVCAPERPSHPLSSELGLPHTLARALLSMEFPQPHPVLQAGMMVLPALLVHPTAPKNSLRDGVSCGLASFRKDGGWERETIVLYSFGMYASSFVRCELLNKMFTAL